MADCNNCSSYLSSEDIIRRSVKCSGGSVAFIGSNVNLGYSKYANYLTSLYDFNTKSERYIYDLKGYKDGLINNAIIGLPAPDNLKNCYQYGGTQYSLLGRTNELFGNSTSVGIWVKITAFPTAGNRTRILMSENDNALKMSLYGNLLECGFENTSGGQTAELTYSGLNSDTWYYIVYSFTNNNNSRLYVNGELVAEDVTPGILRITDDNYVRVGSYNNSIQFFNGYISRVEFWNIQITDEIIEYVYNSGMAIEVGINNVVENSQLSLLSSSAVAPNAASNLTIPTYDGSDQLVHPDIYYNADGWNGYKYWMAMTPYPGSNNAFENPSVVVSNDGITWSVPSGLTNPIIATPAGGYNSDCSIIYANNKLYIFYREYISGVVKIYSISSADGLSWSSRVLRVTNSTLLSPSVLLDGNNYVMYYADFNTYGLVKKISASSIDGEFTNQSSARIYNLPNGIYPYHLKVIKHNALYYMLFVATQSNSGLLARLYLAISNDGINFYTRSTPLINVSADGFDKTLVYQATLIPNLSIFDVWYSASSGSIWRVGKTILTI